jgi:hypothetical protein
VEESGYLGAAIAGLVYCALGTRLLRLAARSRSASDWLLGSSCVLWMLGYGFWVTAIAFQLQPVLESDLLITSRILDSLGNGVFAYFPLLAFRRGSSWGRWLSAGLVTCAVVGTAGSIRAGDLEGVAPLTNLWWWLDWFSGLAPAIWIGSEGFHHYGMSRRRIRLGLCEPIVSHRSLLWGFAGVFWILLECVVVVQYIEFWATRRWSVGLDYLVGICELGALTMIWLIFFPPAIYRRWIERSAASSSIAGG